MKRVLLSVLLCLLVGFVSFSGCTGSTSGQSEIAEPVSDSYMSSKDIAEIVPKDAYLATYVNWKKISDDPLLKKRHLEKYVEKRNDYTNYYIGYFFVEQNGDPDSVMIFNYDNDPQCQITDPNSISETEMYKGFSLSETDAWNSDGYLISGNKDSIKKCIDVMAWDKPSLFNKLGISRIAEFIGSGDLIYFGKNNGNTFGISIVFSEGKEYAKIMVIDSDDSSVAEITEEIEHFAQVAKFRDITVRQEDDYLQFSGEIDLEYADNDGILCEAISRVAKKMVFEM